MTCPLIEAMVTGRKSVAPATPVADPSTMAAAARPNLCQPDRPRETGRAEPRASRDAPTASPSAVKAVANRVERISTATE
jgi:hypothetical protein